MSPSSPDPRYRCEACGNLTRFEVTATRTTRSFHHYTVGGELTVEDQQIIAESIESVVCRWCGSGDSVVEIGESGVSTVHTTEVLDVGDDVSERVTDPAGSSGGVG